MASRRSIQGKIEAGVERTQRRLDIAAVSGYYYCAICGGVTTLDERKEDQGMRVCAKCGSHRVTYHPPLP